VIDRTAEPGTTYWYRLVATTNSGAVGTFGPVSGAAEAIREFGLSGVWPNPSRGPLQMLFSVAKASSVKLSVLDVQGREVQVLASGSYRPGRYQVNWDGRTDRGPLAAGVYFVRYQTPVKAYVTRVVLAP
jgi:hypothetical protein